MKITSRIIGIGLALMLIISLLAFALPAAAAPPGDTVWIAQSKPGIPAAVIDNGADVTDWVQSNDGRVWIVDETQNFIKTGTSGTVWSTVGIPAAATNPSDIAVAADDSGAVVLADNGTRAVYITSDRGVNWSQLPAVPGTGAIQDIAISPARAGTLLGREYAVALADAAAGTAQGGVYIIGATASWAAVGAVGHATLPGTVGNGDFMTVKFSPGYIGDRILVATSANVTGNVGYWLLNTSTNAALANYAPKNVIDLGPAADIGVAAAVKRIDVALPTDFDPTSTPVAYIGVGSVVPVVGDDVYRVTGTAAVDLNAVNPTGATAFLGVDSVGYAGTQSEGKLFAGYVSGALSMVKRTANPTASAPTWTVTKNQPTGSTLTLVAPSVDYASSSKVFAGTMGTESAWNISDDDAVSFYQRSMIDNGADNDWINIEGIEVASDGAAMFFLTDDGADLHVWQSPVPPSSMSQKRVETWVGRGNGAANNAEIYLNPDWAASPTIVVVDGSAAPSNIYITNNGGATWATRTGPGTTAIAHFALADQNTFYAIIGTNFYKSTNQGWTWEPAVAWNTSFDAGQGGIYVAPDGTIFVYDDSLRKSSTGATGTWSGVGTYGDTSNNGLFVVDPNYAENGLVYHCDAGTGLVRRLDVASDTYRDTGYVPTSANQGIKMWMTDGKLYLLKGDQLVRNNAPTAALATMSGSWQRIPIPATASNTGDEAAVDGNTIYVNAGDGATTLTEDIWAIIDSTATAKPVISAPASGTEVSIDPVTGRGVPVTLVTDALGEGQGAFNRWTFRIYDKAAGVATATSSANQTGRTRLTSALGAPFNAMLPNTTYVIQVRGGQTVGTGAASNWNSLWSDPVEVTVQSGTQVTQTYAGPQVLGPQGGGTTGLNPGFAWAPVAGATKYQFIVATDAALTKTIGSTPVEVGMPSYQVMDLDYGTTYFWAVKVLEPTPGEQTISTFTTMDEPVDGGGTTTPPPVVEVPTQPVPDVIVNVPEQTGGGSAISTTAIWAVIGIGAVLIVAVLVLIVRTRRPV